MDPTSGGTAQGVRSSVLELAKLGIHNEIVCLDNPRSVYLKNEDIIIHAIGPSKGPWQYSDRLKPWLFENLQRFDKVVVNGLWLFTGYIFHRVHKTMKRSGKKVPDYYVMPHGMLDPYFQKASGRSLKAMRNLVYWKLIESKVVNNASGILFTAQAELELARIPFKPYKPKRELNVGYGLSEPSLLDLKGIHTLQQEFKFLSKEYFLFLSRIHEKKGVDILLQAYVQILKNGNAESVPLLVIAGPGIDSAFGILIKNYVESQNLLKDKVIFPGMLSGGHKWAAFQCCQAFILPSHQENFGIAVAEALACSKPVLISNQVNIWKEIVQEKAGLAEADTEEGTIKLFKQFLSMNAEEVQLMSKNSRSCFEKHFLISTATEKYVAALKQNLQDA